MSKIRIAIAGSSGRMGRMLIEATLKAEDAELVAAFERPGSPFLGRDAGEFVGAPCGVLVSDDVAAGLAKADCLIDFTRPEGTLAHLELAAAASCAMVIGTTGFSPEQKAQVAGFASSVPVVLAPNMAVGVNAVFKLLDIAARILDEGYDVEVIEAHHRLKVDAPSGTALRMGEVVAQALGRNLEECAIYGREGVTGERDGKTIGFATVRGGDIVGDHTVLFAGIGERIEITHKSGSRMPYALGSLRAARFLRGRSSGLFDMQDVLGLR
ncbi:MAG: 4-hydroxy-tetrahydrodipicolinate reductase [Zoogloea sp.]|nr:4-hydroxy-tetrahydrodipicolinate reductase [Zoogloea sp.]